MKTLNVAIMNQPMNQVVATGIWDLETSLYAYLRTIFQ